jgi:hypothetical protein
MFASQYSVMLSRMRSRDVVAAERPAGLGDLEEDAQQLLDAVVGLFAVRAKSRIQPCIC